MQFSERAFFTGRAVREKHFPLTPHEITGNWLPFRAFEKGKILCRIFFYFVLYVCRLHRRVAQGESATLTR